MLAACNQSADPTPTPSVTASFVQPNFSEATNPLAFKNSSQYASSYTWNFGDGSTDHAATPTHTYAKAGTYQVTLRAYGTHQDSAKTVQSLIVSDYNIFLHATAKIVGVYDCKVYLGQTLYIYNSSGTFTTQYSYTRQRDTVLVVAATGAQTIRINTISGYYAPNESPLVNPKGSGYQFLFPLTTGGKDRTMAHFYAIGDSLLFTEQSHVGHGSASFYDIHGRRRP